jgi:hypothetical protein
LDRLAPAEEPETSRVIEDVFADEGIQVRTRMTVTSVQGAKGTMFVTLRHPDGNPEQLRAQHCLVASGRRPVTDDLNLAAVGVKTGDRGEVLVDAQLRTHHTRIWAAGDVTGHPQFVYVAGAHGALIAHNAFDNAGRTRDYRHLPRVPFTRPQLASVGLTEEQATQRGLDCTCRVLPPDHLRRALVNRDTRGLVKIVAQRGTGRILGVSLVAPSAGDASLAAVYAIKHGMTVDQMADTWAPYLTVAEGLRLAAQTFTRDIALLSCCGTGPTSSTSDWTPGSRNSCPSTSSRPTRQPRDCSVPTRSARCHKVELAGGPTVEAYCAIDALGIPAMLDRDVVISSQDPPYTSEPIRITVTNGQATWRPDQTVVVLGTEHSRGHLRAAAARSSRSTAPQRPLRPTCRPPTSPVKSSPTPKRWPPALSFSAISCDLSSPSQPRTPQSPVAQLPIIASQVNTVTRPRA